MGRQVTISKLSTHDVTFSLPDVCPECGSETAEGLLQYTLVGERNELGPDGSALSSEQTDDEDSLEALVLTYSCGACAEAFAPPDAPSPHLEVERSLVEESLERALNQWEDSDWPDVYPDATCDSFEEWAAFGEANDFDSLLAADARHLLALLKALGKSEADVYATSTSTE